MYIYWVSFLVVCVFSTEWITYPHLIVGSVGLLHFDPQIPSRALYLEGTIFFKVRCVSVRLLVCIIPWEPRFTRSQIISYTKWKCRAWTRRSYVWFGSKWLWRWGNLHLSAHEVERRTISPYLSKFDRQLYNQSLISRLRPMKNVKLFRGARNRRPVSEVAGYLYSYPHSANITPVPD